LRLRWQCGPASHGALIVHCSSFIAPIPVLPCGRPRTQERYAVADRERLVQTFLDLVRIDSPSGEEEGMAQEVGRRLAALGAEVLRDGHGNLIARLGGGAEPFLLSAHLDTVEPGRGITPVIEGDTIRTDGSTVL